MRHLEPETKRRPCEDRGKDWRDVPISHGMPRNSRSHQKLENTRKNSPLESSEGDLLCHHLDFGL